VATNKLAVYSGALRLLGERKLASLSENRPPRFHLDEAWNDGLIRYCLEQGQWGFATRTVKKQASDAYDPSDFGGFAYIFPQPDDFVRTAAISTDAHFDQTLHRYSDEAGFWCADVDTLYIKYISDDPDYGADLTKWPETFKKFVQAQLAYECMSLITGNDGKEERIKQALKDVRVDARSKDAMGRPVKFGQSGSFINARMRTFPKE